MSAPQFPGDRVTLTAPAGETAGQASAAMRDRLPADARLVEPLRARFTVEMSGSDVAGDPSPPSGECA
ncbi:hypothetical protein [Pseudofrankia sp. BMG5.37]|uniref:hypothetical protein n=1 Tax=Pseudofrankia sp. BMG5.37 TaxID=3050035 RepID=UPI002894CDCD|nr:hypothetical protein [Pseudofrankia sp. BMG5.37]MDT3438324.1 hypothetical protein [Pseudofrankia sp. BMG5.37]